VRDTGIGIPPDKQERVFAAFSQADGSTTRRFGGTGLGLSISKQLVERMGGRIWLESEEGTGTTFHFTADFACDNEAIDQPEAEVMSTHLPDVNVLIVDDNETNRRLLENWLIRWGLKFRSVSGGSAALTMLEELRFQLILLDVQMPSMDGFEVATRVRKRWSVDEIKIVLLTSMGLKGDAAQCRELGIEAYLTKPLYETDLLHAVQRLFLPTPADEHGRPRHLITRHSLHEHKTAVPALRPLRILVAEDNKVNQALARRLLEKQGHTVTMVGNGMLAVEAWERSEFDLILMDIQMPEMDGYEAARAIRKREAGGSRIPIVALTAHAMASDHESCLAAGMDAFVSKPIDLADLAAAMVAVCKEGAPVAVLSD